MLYIDYKWVAWFVPEELAGLERHTQYMTQNLQDETRGCVTLKKVPLQS
jgi:hypothetical protein